MEDTQQAPLRRALVTGGAGFIGSHVVDALLAEPELGVERVVVLDDLSGGAAENLPDDARVTLEVASVTDEQVVERLFQEHEFHFVYHLGAYAAEGLSHFIRRFNYTNNLLGSVNLINSAVRHHVECFIFASSIAVYGDAPPPLKEDTPLRPVDPYGIAKYAVELDLAAANEVFGLPYIIFRPHNVYGERQHLGDRYRNVVGIFIKHVLQGLPMPVFGDGTQRRAFTYIGDVAGAIARSPTCPEALNQVFNLGSDQTHTINELARHVAGAMEAPCQVNHLPARHEVHTAYSDHAKAKAVFPSLGSTSLEEGIGRMADWAKQAVIRPGQVFDPLELEEGLPPSWRH